MHCFEGWIRALGCLIKTTMTPKLMMVRLGKLAPTPNAMALLHKHELGGHAEGVGNERVGTKEKSNV